MKAAVWRKIQRENFTKLSPLLDFLKMEEKNRNLTHNRQSFPINVPKRLAEKMRKNDLSCPIFLQFVPLVKERKKTPGYQIDPVQDRIFRKTPKLLQKYPSRALLLTSGACAMHCRYCFRQNFPYEGEGYEEELQYIRKDPSLQEIILSGGDPLSLSNALLEKLLISLDSIEHLQRIRFHTRFPIGIPERIDFSFLQILEKIQKQIFFVVHVNHPDELDSDVLQSLKQIQKLGIPVLNQTVFLQGVNDEKEILLHLFSKLSSHGIIPYYLHLLDPVEGAHHFAAEKEKAQSFLAFIRENLSGFAVPKLAVEIPGEKSKTILL